MTRWERADGDKNTYCWFFTLSNIVHEGFCMSYFSLVGIIFHYHHIQNGVYCGGKKFAKDEHLSEFSYP